MELLIHAAMNDSRSASPRRTWWSDAFTDPTVTRHSLAEWAQRLGNPKLAALPLRDPPFVITESLSRQNYKFLWDILFERHPHGAYIRGKWEAQGDKRTDIPGDKLIVGCAS